MSTAAVGNSKRLRTEPQEVSVKKQELTAWNTAPSSLLFLIFEFSQAKTILTSFRVCKQWSYLESNILLWRIMYLNELYISPLVDQPLISLQTEVRWFFKATVKYRDKKTTYQVANAKSSSLGISCVGINALDQFFSVSMYGDFKIWDVSNKKIAVTVCDLSKSLTKTSPPHIVKIQLFQRKFLLIAWNNLAIQLWRLESKVPTIVATLEKNADVTAWDCFSNDEALLSFSEGDRCNAYRWDVKKNALSLPIISGTHRITFIQREADQIFFGTNGRLTRFNFPSTTDSMSLSSLDIPNFVSAENVKLEYGHFSFIGGASRTLEVWDCETNKLMRSFPNVEIYTRSSLFFIFQSTNVHNCVEIRSLKGRISKSLPFKNSDSSTTHDNEASSYLQCTSTGDIFLFEGLIKEDDSLTALYNWNFPS